MNESNIEAIRAAIPLARATLIAMEARIAYSAAIGEVRRISGEAIQDERLEKVSDATWEVGYAVSFELWALIDRANLEDLLGYKPWAHRFGDDESEPLLITPIVDVAEMRKLLARLETLAAEQPLLLA